MEATLEPQLKISYGGIIIYWKFDRGVPFKTVKEAGRYIGTKFTADGKANAGYDGDDLVKNRLTIVIKAAAYKLLNGELIYPIRLN